MSKYNTTDKKKSVFKTTMNQAAFQNTTLHELTEEESKALKKCMLDMYRDVYEVCKKHKIKLLLAGGSTLGCIRHQGFIPWDDDLDLMMTRGDYNRLKIIFEKELGRDYILCAPNSREKAKARFPKIIKKNTVFREITDVNSEKYPSGVFMDIFIFDKIPSNALYRRIKGNVCNVIMYASTCAYWYEQKNEAMIQFASQNKQAQEELKKRLTVGKICHRIMPASKWFDLADRAIQFKGKTNLLGLPSGSRHYFGEIFNWKQIYPPKVRTFEGVEALVPADYDTYLTNLYGDYMQIPPADKRERHFVVEFDLKGSMNN